MTLHMSMQVRDNYLQTINNIQLADAEAIYQSQLAMNSSIRYITYIYTADLGGGEIYVGEHDA